MRSSSSAAAGVAAAFRQFLLLRSRSSSGSGSVAAASLRNLSIVLGPYSGSGRRLSSSWMRSVGMNGCPVGVRGMSRGDKELGETSTIHQDEGGQIQEVPLAVLKTNEDGERGEEEEGKERNGRKRLPYLHLDIKEEEAFIEGFNNFNSPQEVIKMLDTIPTQEVTPYVSVGILRRLFQLENNFVYRNDGMPWTVTSENSVTDTFARTAIVTRLIDTIVTTDKPEVLLQALSAIQCEKPIENGSDYRNRLFEEILLRVTKGQFTLPQVCEAVITLGKIEQDTAKTISNNLIDKLWVGMVEKSDSIDEHNIMMLFQVLPYFKKSQRLVLNLAERKLLSLWWKMDMNIVATICETLLDEKPLQKDAAKAETEQCPKSSGDKVKVSNRVLSALSRCTSLNIHQVTESQLLAIVKAFQTHSFCDETAEKALNKYMKAKCLKICNPKVLSAVLDYIKKFNIRSESILEAAAEYVVVRKAEEMSPPDITSVVTACGHLDFQPPNGPHFWQIIEAYLNEKFIQFSPKDMIEVLLSCVHLNKYPLNFVGSIFSPYFLDRVHTCDLDYTRLQNLRSKLKLLDTALTIECPSKYGGPMLPKDFTARSVFIDGRILRAGNWLEDTVKEVVGVRCSVEKFVVLPNLPLNAAYIADILVANVRRFESERHNYLKNRIAIRLNSGLTPDHNERGLTAILIHVPEHFTRDGKLVGSEVMRIRHLKLLGFNVATVDCTKLFELRPHPTRLREHLKEKIMQAGFQAE